MELLLLNLFAFLRPALFIEADLRIGGLYAFELAAIFFALLLFAMLIYKMGLRKQVYVSSIDLIILLFSIWCIAIYAAYSNDTDLRKVAKLIIPFWTFIIVKNVIADSNQYRNLIFILLVGFTIPLVLSVALIMSGKGVYEINYWSKLERYKGAYSNPHNMGHNATFLIMMVITYITMSFYSIDGEIKKLTPWKKFFLSLLVLLAVFCLYKCWVRTAVAGLIVFFIVYLFFYNRRLLFLSTVGLIVLGILFAPVIVPRFLNDVKRVMDGEIEFDRLGSGRLELWKDKLEGFNDLPIDRKIAGAGIGNQDMLTTMNVDSHNDILGVLEETGLVGFLLYMLLQFFILKRILSMEGQEKHVFVAIFVAVFFMNFMSNSYISRFGMAQFFYLIMAYIDIPRTERAKISRSLSTSSGSTGVIVKSGV